MKQDGTSRTVSRNAATVAGLSIARGILGFPCSVIVARALGPSGQGRYGFYTTTVTVLVLIGAMGISNGMTHAKAKLGCSVRELYGSSFVIALGTAAAITPLFLGLFSVFRKSLFDPLVGADVVLVVVLMPILLVSSHWTAAAYLEDRVSEFARAALVAAALLLAACGIASARGDLTPRYAIVLWSLGASVPLALVVGRRRSALACPRSDVVRHLLRFGFATNAATLALILVWRVDVYLVAATRGGAELGQYSVAVGLGEILLQIGVSFRIALTPLQGSPEGRGDLEQAIVDVSKLAGFAGGLAAIGMIVLANPLVGVLYGDSFLPAGAALVWLVPGVVALVLQGPLVDYLLTEGRVRGVTVIAVGALGANVATNAVLLPGHTFVVAAGASTATYTGGLVAFLLYFAQVTGRPAREFIGLPNFTPWTLRRRNR